MGSTNNKNQSPKIKSRPRSVVMRQHIKNDSITGDTYSTPCGLLDLDNWYDESKDQVQTPSLWKKLKKLDASNPENDTLYQKNRRSQTPICILHATSAFFAEKTQQRTALLMKTITITTTTR